MLLARIFLTALTIFAQLRTIICIWIWVLFLCTADLLPQAIIFTLIPGSPGAECFPAIWIILMLPGQRLLTAQQALLWIFLLMAVQ